MYAKFACAIALYAIWATVVILQKLDPTDLLAALKYGLYAIGGLLGVIHLQAVPKDELDGSAPRALPEAPPKQQGGAPQAPSFPSKQ